MTNQECSERSLFIGLMSGTSLDGVDAVLADFSGPSPLLIGHAHHDFAPEVRRELLALNTPGWDDLHRAAVVSQHLARAYAAAVEDVLLHTDTDANRVAAIGAHGQTVRHRPDEAYTIQLNAPATLAELTGIDVVADFRSRDIAAGGQGAPLVPAFHAAVFTTDAPRASVNIGGISNVSTLPARGASDAVTGFDCGPGNVLLDAWALEHLGEPIDRNGRWASGGHCDAALLQALLQEPFFEQAPPRSTGRELFNVDWLKTKLAGRQLDPQHVQTTLTRFTATTIAASIQRFFPQAADVLICGGGAYNATLMRMLEEECEPLPISSTAAFGIAPEHVEALAFAWLARAHVRRESGNVATVTGALGPRVLGALYPA